MSNHCENENVTYTTTTREDFRPFQLPLSSADDPPRRELLKHFYRTQAAKQIFEEMKTSPEEKFKIDYTTSYHRHYDIKDFKPKDIMQTVDPEMVAKYPLYDDPPMSVYLDKIDRIKPSAKARLPMNAFRKSSSFVKKWYDELE
ncbi:Hypothetical protein NTJ_00524 [Nesidiocoris tenuis]|uniref:Uncharacterized protein n=1 Tax=Nesidiocoris tenuis TaxID=355587 RepID=A0ABN7A9A6_9HEMI|nr:Hypothetical protein NTJ_00524 [Nesidiocoris tenuis]